MRWTRRGYWRQSRRKRRGQTVPRNRGCGPPAQTYTLPLLFDEKPEWFSPRRFLGVEGRQPVGFFRFRFLAAVTAIPGGWWSLGGGLPRTPAPDVRPIVPHLFDVGRRKRPPSPIQGNGHDSRPNGVVNVMAADFNAPGRQLGNQLVTGHGVSLVSLTSPNVAAFLGSVAGFPEL
jgi:hypothetical protein